MENQPKKHLSPWIAWSIVLLVAGSAGFAVWFYWNDVDIISNNVSITTIKKTDNSDKVASETADWKTYIDTVHAFSFKYPKEWSDISLSVLNMDGNNGSSGSYMSNDTAGNRNVDLSNVFRIFTFSNDYKPGAPIPDISYNKVSMDVNWSADQIEQYMGFKNGSNRLPQVLLAKKLNNKLILIGDYENMECSPSFRLQVITPLNDAYPNLQIQINTTFDKNKIITDYESIQTAEKLDACDESEQYQQIADQIKNGTYSDELNNQIKTAQLIADSLTTNQ